MYYIPCKSTNKSFIYRKTMKTNRKTFQKRKFCNIGTNVAETHTCTHIYNVFFCCGIFPHLFKKKINTHRVKLIIILNDLISTIRKFSKEYKFAFILCLVMCIYYLSMLNWQILCTTVSTMVFMRNKES